MVSKQSVHRQLKNLGFKTHGWGRGEVNELHNIILPGEEIYEVVNGIYEGGFALLIATDVRVVLVDKKPLNYLTVEDLRFDMINEIDYSHRLLGAQINVATGNKDLKFRSYNQQRLRKLIGHVQHSMAEAKKKQSSHQQDQNTHLEQINQQLQTYLMAQNQYQLQMQQMQQAGMAQAPIAPPKPGHELSDYLYAQSLLAQHQAETGVTHPSLQPATLNQISQYVQPAAPQVVSESAAAQAANPQLRDLYEEGLQEIFGGKPQPTTTQAQPEHRGLEINAMRVAYSKLPMALRNRKFGRPSLHAHSQQQTAVPSLPVAPAEF